MKLSTSQEQSAQIGMFIALRVAGDIKFLFQAAGLDVD
jgi:hypothetical protein